MDLPKIPSGEHSLNVTVSEDSKTAGKLLDALRAGLGNLYEPIGIVRRAKADATANEIAARSEAKIEQLKHRSRIRVEQRELRRQRNIDAVVGQTVDLLPETPKSDEPVNEDWAARFFEHVQDIGDAEMQTLWAKILAGEVSQPNSYALRTLDCLKSMSKQDAELFAKMIRFAWSNTDDSMFVMDGPPLRKFWDPESIEMFSSMFALSSLKHLTGIGLIHSAEALYEPPALKGLPFRYFDQTYVIEDSSADAQPTGLAGMFRLMSKLYFTQIGNQLFRVAERTPVEGYAEAQIEHLGETLNAGFRKLSAV